MPSKIPTGNNNLNICNPNLAKEWHPSKNGNLTPRAVTAGSRKKVWWLCPKGHEYQAIINNRKNGDGCHYCSGKRVNDENCLQNVNPTLASQWHPTKNGSLTPKNVTPHSHKKVWWKCLRGHEWPATVNDRSNLRGCPYCHSSTSQLELRVYTEMKYLFHDTQHRKKIHGVECDVFLPSLNLAVEIDGAYFHKDKYELDKRKTNTLKKANVDLVRIREKGLSKVSGHDILCKTKRIDFSIIRSLIQQILCLRPITVNVRDKVQDYLIKSEFANNQEFIKIWNMLPSPFPELSLQAINPALAQEWHSTKNGSLTPRDVTVGSNKIIWWQCSKGHEWLATIHSRSGNGKGCPYCSNQKTNNENCLQTVNPILASQWHPTKNGSLTPRDVTVGSEKKIWWLCSKGHEWVSVVYSRNKGIGCPFCAGRRVNDENCLQALNPILAKEWHPTKNGNLTPRNITLHSGLHAWWQCSKEHEWKMTVNDRSKGHGCPYCAGKKVNKDNCLKTVNPVLAKEWHPTKNGDLQSINVTAYNHKKVWWKCSIGHEWLAAIRDRSNGTGCPHCYRQRRKHL